MKKKTYKVEVTFPNGNIEYKLLTLEQKNLLNKQSIASALYSLLEDEQLIKTKIIKDTEDELTYSISIDI